MTTPPKPWEICKHHGPAEHNVWACPTCLAELRDKVARLTRHATEQPVQWWNGIRVSDIDSGMFPSYSPKETSSHDIPLYAGHNAASALVEALKAENEQLKKRVLMLEKVWADSIDKALAKTLP